MSQVAAEQVNGTESRAEADARVAAVLQMDPAPGNGVAPEGQQDPAPDPDPGPDIGAEELVLEDLPDGWQDEIRRLRRENANARVRVREATRKAPQTSPDPPTAAATSEASIRAAEERGRSAARMEYGVQLARAEVKAALAANFTEEQITDLVDDLDLSRLVQDDGSVDAEAIGSLKEKYVSLLASAGRKPPPRVGHGRTSPAPAAKDTATQFAEFFGGHSG